MKNRTLKKLPPAFRRQPEAHSIRVIKAHVAQALLTPPPVVEKTPVNQEIRFEKPTPRHAPEIHLLATGPDYCDLEVICGCGETSKIRCWNSLKEQVLESSAA